MDIANATAAGPSRGLLDVIFGSKQEAGEAEADGQGFGNLMNLIKVLNMKKEVEAQGADMSRTPTGETMLGKNVADGVVVGMPGMNAQIPGLQGDPLAAASAMEELQKREQMQKLAALGVPAAALMMQAPVPSAMALQPGTMQPELVNQMLQAKGLPALGPQEMKLLQSVNAKLAQAAGQKEGAEIPPELLAGGAGMAALDPALAQALPKAATPNGAPAIDPQLAKAMAAKGMDPKKLKAAETSAQPGTPEKLLTTETYLQMHENAAAAQANGKPQGPSGKQPQLANADGSPQTQPTATLTAGAVAGAAQKGPNLGSKKDDGAQLPEGAKQSKLDALAAGGFGAALAQSKTEAMKHDVYLPGADKPEQRANVLQAEIGSSVLFNAHKGGGEMRLVIHPDDLGEVKLKVGTKNGKVDVQVTAENEDVAKMIRGGSKDLEASLKDQNLSLAKFEVTVDASSVASTDTKSGLNEQFLSQNQQQQHGGFSQGSLNDDSSRNTRWGADQGGNGRGNGGFSSHAEENARSTPKAASFVPKMTARASGGPGRLNVVA
jgi:hypothetical protein